METTEDQPTRLRLSVWEDGSVSLSVHQRDTRRHGGWAFQYTGRGVAAHLKAKEIVAMLEETGALVYGGTRAKKMAEQIDATWASAHLERER